MTELATEGFRTHWAGRRDYSRHEVAVLRGGAPEKRLITVPLVMSNRETIILTAIARTRVRFLRPSFRGP